LLTRNRAENQKLEGIMKKIAAFSLLGVLILGLSFAVSASPAARMRVDVPFAFYAEREMLPAGSYIFEIGSASPASATGTSVVIRNLDNTSASVIFTMNASGLGKIAEDCLRFNKYGNKYFLARVEGLGYIADVKPTRMERELRAQAGPRHETTLVGGN
jgi:hypothetical protein